MSRAHNIGSRLEELVAQVQDGQTRDLRDARATDYYAKRLSYMLHPRDLQMASLAFDIDQNPTGMGSARSAAAWSANRKASPARDGDAIAIKLDQLVVHRTGSWFGGDIRIDAVVCTRVEGIRDPLRSSFPRMYTARFPDTRKEQPLPLEGLLLFVGPVRSFVDIAIFVSRARARPDLTELIEQHAANPELRDAAGALIAPADTAADTPWVAAVGASAVFMRIAHELVVGEKRSARDSLGLYRTSFLADERFGIGRHPAEGMYRAQDFSFSLTIEAITPRL